MQSARAPIPHPSTTLVRLFHLLIALAFAAVAVLFFLPWLAHAQEAADKPIGSVWDTALTLWASAGSAVLLGLGWLVNKGVTALVTWLGSKTTNELALHGLAAIGRLKALAGVVVTRVNEKEKAAILAAKDPASPGGVAITEIEAAGLKQVAKTEIIACCGGWERMLSEFRYVVFGDGAALESLIDNHIEAAVKETKSPDPSVPLAA